MEAARVYTCGAVDSGQKPAVISAVVKLQQTELLRRLVLDGMDVLGGAALCRGPRNLLADAYTGAAIGITVEGANILTRTLIIFGQGAVRCHPYAQREIRALAAEDAKGLRRALLGHVGFLLGNLARSALLGLTRGRLARSPVPGPTARYYRRLAWASARFAVLADLAMLSLGGKLKLREKLSGRFADALSFQYLGFCALRRFEAEGRREEDLPLVRWALDWSLAQVQEAFDGIYRNFEGPLAFWMRGPAAFWSRLSPLGAPPSDRLGARIAALLQTPGAQRDRLTADVHLPADPDQAVGRLERAFVLVSLSREVMERVRAASRDGRLPKGDPEALLDAALAAGVVDRREADLAREAACARRDAIEVDSFTLEEYLGLAAASERELATAS
jgi:acyl-CoA dehydrogenase